jgi:hypothetical protein
MLSFSLIPKISLVTGFQPTVNQTEKPSPQTPTPINQPLPEDTFTPIPVQSRAGGFLGDIFVKLWRIAKAEKDLKKALKNYLEASNELKLEDYKEARQVEERLVKDSTERIIQWILEKESRTGTLTPRFQLLNRFINSDITDEEKMKSLLDLLAVLESKQQAFRALIQPQNQINKE